MNIKYKIKAFSNLTDEEIYTLYKFCHSYQPDDFYSNLNDMKEYYSSSSLNRGKNQFSLWINDDIKASGGYVDLMAEEKKEIYITQAFASKENIFYWELIYAHIIDSIRNKLGSYILNSVSLKLGIRGQSNSVYDWGLNSNFIDDFDMLKMKYDLSKVPNFHNSNNLVCHESLSSENWKIFRDIHDKAFVPIPNGGRLNADTYEEYLTANSHFNHFKNVNLLFYHNNLPIGVSILDKEGSDIFIDALAVNPEFHSQGYGMLILKYLSNYLKNIGYKNLKLIVANNNTPAYNLYLKYGFASDGIYVKWLKKKFD